MNDGAVLAPQVEARATRLRRGRRVTMQHRLTTGRHVFTLVKIKIKEKVGGLTNDRGPWKPMVLAKRWLARSRRRSASWKRPSDFREGGAGGL